jgi:RNA polymerase sigma factor (sigma-70 family)
MNTYRNFVYSTALRYVNNHYDADDVTQEVFIKAFKNLKRFKFKSSLKTWLYQITKNHCYTLFSKSSKYNNVNTGEMEESELDRIFQNNDTPLSRVEAEEFYDAFHNALNKLPEKQRETFALRYFEDMPYQEISELLGTSVGGLKANYYQAVKKLSSLIERD